MGLVLMIEFLILSNKHFLKMMKWSNLKNNHNKVFLRNGHLIYNCYTMVIAKQNLFKH